MKQIVLLHSIFLQNKLEMDKCSCVSNEFSAGSIIVPFVDVVYADNSIHHE